MLVLRVENENGDGPYWLGPGYEYIHGSMDGTIDYDRHPPPFADGIRKIGKCIFGFSSLSDLKAWFNARECIRLKDHAYRVSVFEVPREAVRPGQSQVVFKRGCANKIGTWDFDHIPDTIDEHSLATLQKETKDEKGVSGSSGPDAYLG